MRLRIRLITTRFHDFCLKEITLLPLNSKKKRAFPPYFRYVKGFEGKGMGQYCNHSRPIYYFNKVEVRKEAGTPRNYVERREAAGKAEREEREGGERTMLMVP